LDQEWTTLIEKVTPFHYKKKGRRRAPAHRRGGKADVLKHQGNWHSPNGSPQPCLRKKGSERVCNGRVLLNLTEPTTTEGEIPQYACVGRLRAQAGERVLKHTRRSAKLPNTVASEGLGASVRLPHKASSGPLKFTGS